MGRIFLIGLVAGVSVLACRGTDDSAGTGLLQPHGEQVTPDVNGRYIVVYKPSVVDAVAEMDSHVTPLGVTAERVYQYAFRGWAGHLSAAELAKVQADPHVAFVEADQVVRLSGVQTPTPSWGLDRIDQVNLPRDATYHYSRTGAGVHFYGIDTGILYTHNDFGGRASPAPGFDAGIPATGGVDCSGHGTHTASTAGGTSYGVAKSMTIVGVRVFDCFRTGSVSQIISGVDWVTQHAIKPAVANMSIEVPVSAALNLAVTNSIATGVVYVVAAGNDNGDACGYSPASTPLAITVGAMDSLDARASFSNFGTCVDIFAPGVKTVAAVIASNSAFQAASGTSMASPHVAGVVGLYLEAHPTATPAQVTAAILAGATIGHVSNPGAGSPNLLIYSGFVGAPANQSPTATILAPANNATFVTGSTVSFSGTGTDPEDGTLTGASLVWTSSRDGPIGTGTGFSTSSLSVGTHTITLTVKDAQNATGSAVRSITITPVANQSPTATITAPANNASFVAGTSVTFTGSGSDPEDGALSGASLVWTSSLDFQIGTGTTFSTKALSVGTHTITLTAKDAQNATGIATRTITITAPVNHSPTATITAPVNNASFVAGSSVSFSGTGTDPESGTLTGASLVWTSSRDGQIGTGTSFSKTTLSVGTHVITLTAKDPQNATGTATRTITITAPVNQSPTATITTPANNASFVAGSSVSFSGTGTDPESGTLTGASLVWTSSRDGQIGTGTAFSTSTLSVGTHSITLTAKDPQNATGTATRTITITAPVNQSPTATITAPAGNASFVAGSSVSFSGTGSDPEDGVLTGASLVWTSSLDGQIGTGTGFSTSALSVGIHTITLTAKDAQNATGAATRTITITAPVNQSPTATITAPAGNASFVAGSSVSFSGTGSDPEDGVLTGASLVWTSSQDGQIGTGTGFSTSALSVGIHTITLTAKDAQNATGTATRTITVTAPVNQAPTATITAPANHASFVAGSTVTFSGTGSDPESGTLSGASLVWTSSWNGLIGTGSGFSTSGLSVGTHVITLIAKDPQNATGTATRTITITAPVNQSPTATITAPASNASFVVGSSISFSGTANDPEDGVLGGAALTWTSNLQGQIGTGTGFSRSDLAVGTHLITLTARDGQNAVATATRSITVTSTGNQAPVASITSPADHGTFPSGAVITFTGTGFDPEDGSLVGGALVWTSSLQGVLGTGGTLSRNDLMGGLHVITLTVTDSGNAKGTATLSITVMVSAGQPQAGAPAFPGHLPR